MLVSDLIVVLNFKMTHNFGNSSLFTMFCLADDDAIHKRMKINLMESLS